MSLRRLLVILLAVFGGATVALASLAAVLGGTPTGLNAVRRLAQWGSMHALSGRMTIGRIEGTAWERLIIHDLSLSLPDNLGGEVIGAERVEVVPDVRALLKGQYRLKTVTVDGLRLAYIDGVGPRNTNTITLLFKLGLGPPPTTPEPPVPLNIPELRVRQGRFLYFDRWDSSTVDVRDVFFRGSMTDTGHLSGSLWANRAALSINGFQDSLATITSEFRLHGDSLTVTQITAQAAALPPLTVQAAGEIAPLSEAVASLTLRAQGDVGAIARLIGGGMTLRGPFHLTGSLTRTLADPSISARLEADDIDTDIGRVRQTALDLRYAHNRLTVDRYTGLTDAGRVSGSGWLDFAGPVERYRLTLEPSQLALERVPSTLVGSGLPLAGEATLSAGLDGVGFDHPELRGTATAAVPGLVIAGTRVGSFSAQARYDRGQVALTARTPVAAVEAQGQLTTAGQTDVKGLVTVPDLRAFTALWGDSSAAGTVVLTTAVRGPVTRPDVQVDGQITGLGYGDLLLGTLRVTGGLDPDGLASLKAGLDTSAVVLTVQADRARDWRLNGRLAVHRFRLHEHLPGIDPDWSLDGTIDLDGTIQGRLAQPEFKGNGLARDLAFRGERLGSTSLALTLNDERDLQFTLVTQDFGVVSNGLVSLTDDFPFHVQVTLTRADLSAMLAGFSQQKARPHTGRVTGQVRALGLASHPELSTVTMTLDSLNLALDDLDLRLAAPSTIRLDQHVVTVDSLAFVGNAGRLTLHGRAGLTDDGPLQAGMGLDGMQLDFLSPFVLSRGSLLGTVNVQLAATGSPVAPVVNGTVTTSEIQYRLDNRTNDLGAARTSVVYVDRVLHIPDLALDTPFGTSQATGTFPIDLSWAGRPAAPAGEAFTVSVQMDHLALGPLREFLPAMPVDLDGRVNGRLDLAGPMAHPSASVGTVRLDSLRVFANQYELTNRDSLIVRFDAGHLDVEALQVVFRPIDQRQRALGWLTATGQVALSARDGREETSDLTVTGRDIALEAPVELAGWTVPLTGRFDGDVRLTGPRSAPSLEGRVRLAPVRYDSATVDSLAGRFVYEHGTLVVHEFLAWVRGKTLNAYGTIPFEPAGAESEPGNSADMALTVDGADLDLRFLNGISYDLEHIEGMADVHLAIGGTPFAPKSVGALVIRDGKVQVRDIAPPLQVPRLRLVVDGDRLTVEPADLKAGRGNIALDGRAVLRNFSFLRFESKATAKNADVEVVGTARLGVNGTLAFTGDRGRSRVDGQLRVTGTIIEPLNLQQLALGGRVLRPASAPSPFLERMAVNVEVDIPQLQVRNDLADVAVEGGLAITNTGQNPILTGNASATEGVITYLGTKFQLESGRLELTKRTPLDSFSAILDDPIQQLDPVVTLRAEADQVSDNYGTKYRVTLALDGRVIDPTLNLQATPIPDLSSSSSGVPATALSGGDVFALLTFGLPGLTSLPRGGAFTRIGNRALLMAGGKQAERLLNLDEVRIEGDIFNATNPLEPARITISKRINRRTEVTYTQSIGEGAPYKIRIGYRLSDMIYIETSTEETVQTQQQSGLDLKLKFRFQ